MIPTQRAAPAQGEYRFPRMTNARGVCAAIMRKTKAA
jgi:hypothetical protein